MGRESGKMVSIKGERGSVAALLFVVFPGESAQRMRRGKGK